MKTRVFTVTTPRHATPRHATPGQARPGQEAYAVLDLQERGYETYVHILQAWFRRGGQWCTRQGVMFPRYAFVRPPDGAESLRPARSTHGGTTLVKDDPVLASMARDKLAASQALLADWAAGQLGQPPRVGQHEVFASGPL